MKTVHELIIELSNFPADKTVRFFDQGFSGDHGVIDRELKIIEYDQDDNGNPTFLMEEKKC
jgi:hypothetical protein